nr:hypothetical protein [Rhodothermus profundi]
MRTYCWRRKAFDKLAEIGLLVPDDRLILQKTSFSSRHAAAIRRGEESFRGVFLLQQFDMRVQLLRALDRDSEPAPDVVAEEAPFDDTVTAHPTTAVVEGTSALLSFDRVLEIPRPPEDAPYGSSQALSPPDALAPRARPGASIERGRLFPNPRA